jgi:hypothetical protein
MSFAVVRHPEAGTGIAPEAVMPQMRANGWVRISEYRKEPNEFHLPEFADVTTDLDAPTKPAKSAETTSKEKAA